jgi:ABC-type transporter Mla MlaB component
VQGFLLPEIPCYGQQSVLGVFMKNSMTSGPGLHFILDEKSEETIVYCSGQITTRSAQWFEQEICSRVIPVSRGKGVAVTSRIMLDFAEVFHIDNTGMASLFALWRAAQQKCCAIEIHNFGMRPGALAQWARRITGRIRTVVWARRMTESFKEQ